MIVLGRYLLPMAVELAADLPVIVRDLPGYGLSDPAPVAPLSSRLQSRALARHFRTSEAIRRFKWHARAYALAMSRRDPAAGRWMTKGLATGSGAFVASRSASSLEAHSPGSRFEGDRPRTRKT